MQALFYLVAVVALTALLCLAALPVAGMAEGGGKLLAQVALGALGVGLALCIAPD